MLTPAEIIIGGTGRIYVAPEGTPRPTFLSDPLDPLFADVGYTTEDGCKFTDGKTTNEVRVWQSFYPVRVHITGREGKLEFTLVQWNPETIALAFGGGTFTEPAPGEFRYNPPAPESLAVVAIVVDIFDGARTFRHTTGRGFVTSNTESTFAKKGPALLPIELAILADGEEQPWTIDSDDLAWMPAAS